MTETTKTQRRTFKLDEIEQAINSGDYIGFCLACGTEQGGCEPDACEYECETCGANKVYGAEEILIMGLVT